MKILLADDHQMVRLALRVALAGLGPAEFVEANSAEAAMQIVDADQAIDLAIIDINMPGVGGVEGVRKMRQAHPALPIAVCSATDDAALIRSLIDMGVSAFIPKSDSTEVILHAVKLVLAGGSYVPARMLAGNGSAPQALAQLTPRQRDVLRLLAEGKSNKLIARELHLTESTVKVHLLAVFRLLGAHNRTEAVMIAQRMVQAHS